MLAEQRIERIYVKVERAKEHFQSLEGEVYAYLASKPYSVGIKRDPISRRPIYFLKDIHPTPLKISAILGDTINNLRSALDHLAYQLVWLGTGDPPSEHVYFPISDDRAKYFKQGKEKIKGARAQAINAIDELEPYRGGNDTLWRLHKLNNVDKHRILITAGSTYSINLGAYLFRKMQRDLASHPKFSQLGDMPPPDAFYGDRMFPLKVGDELFIDVPDAIIDEQLQFKFELVFAEKDVITAEPILETVQPMIELVNEIVVGFAPLLV